MRRESPYPGYVPRPEEQVIRDEVGKVRPMGKSRALLLYGPGGVGKTSLVRGLAKAYEGTPKIAWLDPVDVDDPEYWLLANLERKVARQLDPESKYFGPYFEYLLKPPDYAQPRIGRETVVSHLGRIKRVFNECYEDYLEDTGNTVVMTFDTVEAMRGVYLLYTLTQWIKSLRTGTFFILSGRPMLQPGDRPDPIRDELEDEHQNLPVTLLTLGTLSRDTALDYLRRSLADADLSPEEEEKLAVLTRGHPLWLAFAISYVRERGMPDVREPGAASETEPDLAAIKRLFPEAGKLSLEAQRLDEAFKRRLVSPYREADFWHETVNRLAVIRQGVTQPIWERLMSDRPESAGLAGTDDAWSILQQTPWIRTRASGRYVTLHDAVAEELALRMIPVHDTEQQGRRELWARAAAIYRELTEAAAAEFADMQALVDDSFSRAVSEGAESAQGELVAEVVRLDAQSRELDQLKVVGLHYQLLSDFAAGSRQFLDLFSQAKRDYNVFLQDRLALEMQRFLPGSAFPYALEDVISSVLDDFRRWLSGEGIDAYLELGMAVGGYLIDNEQPRSAIELLNQLPGDIADNLQRCRLNLLKANAYMRIPRDDDKDQANTATRVPQGIELALSCLHQALAAAEATDSEDGRTAVAETHKEFGFYYRNAGRWQQADHAYKQARDAILVNMSARDSDRYHEDMASVETNWAYLKGLTGDSRDGASLVDSAIETRRRLNLYLQEGISLSVRGEIYRYERRYNKAWAAYGQAEQIFQGSRDWSWLGVIYQQQAVCLVQAAGDDISLVPGRDPAEQAKHLIIRALDICRDQNLRGYPSALNRAGRIFGAADLEVGLGYLQAAIDWARDLSDGWFWFSSLIEYVELSYHAWAKTGRPELREAIEGKASFIHRAMSEYEFSDFRGRWYILRGHLAVHDFLADQDYGRLDVALDDYKEGFRLVAQTYEGSSGASSFSTQFTGFLPLFSRLPREVQARWRSEFRSAWWTTESGSTQLLARLEQLY